MINLFHRTRSSTRDPSDPAVRRILWIVDDRELPNRLLSCVRTRFIFDVIQSAHHQLTVCPIKRQWFRLPWRSPIAKHKNFNCSKAQSAKNLAKFLLSNHQNYDVIWINQKHVLTLVEATIVSLNKSIGDDIVSRPRVVYEAGEDIEKSKVDFATDDWAQMLSDTVDAVIVFGRQDQVALRERLAFTKPVYRVSKWAGIADNCKSSNQRGSILIFCDEIDSSQKAAYSFYQLCRACIKENDLNVRLVRSKKDPDPYWMTQVLDREIELVDEEALQLSDFDNALLMVVFEAVRPHCRFDQWVQWGAERRVPAMVSPIVNLRLSWDPQHEIYVMDQPMQQSAQQFKSLVEDEAVWQQLCDAANARAMLNSESKQDSREVLDALFDKPLRLVSFHEGKTAGSSLMSILADVYAPSIQYFYGDHRDTKVPDAHCFHGHFVSLSNQISMRRAPLITFYREPLERAISFFFYQMERHNLTPDDFLPWLDSHAIDGESKENRGAAINLHRPSYQNHLLGRGLCFESFDFIGITEHFDLSLKLLSRYLNWPKELDLERRTNVGKNRPQALTLDNDVVKRYKRHYAADYELYERAKVELFRKARIAGLEDYLFES